MTDKEILLATWKSREITLSTIDDHTVDGFAHSEPYSIPIEGTLEGELKNGFMLHAKGILKDNTFETYHAVIDNHVGGH